MNAEDLRTKTQDELKDLLGDLKKQQFNLRFQRSQGQLENTAQIKAVRRSIARVKTFLGAGAVSAPKAKGAVKEKAAVKPKKKTAAKTA